MFVCRAAPLSRILSLWQRQVVKGNPKNPVKIHYAGEFGIDSGAIAKEFFTDVVDKIGKELFPNGSPLCSTFQVQNGNFKTAGQIIVASLVQGGPPPKFLAECVFDQMINPLSDMTLLDNKALTEHEQHEIDNLLNDLDGSQDQIIDHGYTGKIEKDRVPEIEKSLMFSMVSRRVIYLQEFMAGLEHLAFAKELKKHPDLCKPLFVKSCKVGEVDADYVFSLICPNYSEKGTTRRALEEGIVDHFQDYLLHLEDDQDKIQSSESAIAWNYSETQGEQDIQSLAPERFEETKPSPPVVLKWLTGTSSKPLDGSDNSIKLNFDHDCQKRNPSHRICFPVISACARELTLPVLHCKTLADFSSLFSISVCKAQAFGRP